LFKSCQVIYGHCPKVLNKKAEALLAFKISTKGAIRQAPSAITWFITLANLSRYGVTDPSAVIAEWNRSNGKTSALVGGKAMAVKLLLEKAPKTCANFLIQHVGAWGWNNCAFSDDGLASKKIYLGLETSEAWLGRSKPSR